MLIKILTCIFDAYFYICKGCCSNCVYSEACSKLNDPPCSFMDGGDNLNYYQIDKTDSYYRICKERFLSRFKKKKP